MTLGRALHQKPEESGRDEVGNGEARADAPRDEARLAYQQQEGLGREDLFWQALSRENMAHTQTHMTSTSRTARCGPACRVVWQGRSLTAAPYADLRTMCDMAGVGGPYFVSCQVIMRLDSRAILQFPSI